MPFDTLKAKNQLVEEYGHAEGIVSVIASADEVATKKDLEVLEARLTRKLYGAIFLAVSVLAAPNFFT